MTPHASSLSRQLRPLAAALATFCAASTIASESTVSHATFVVPLAPANIVVENCNDSGAGSLRDAINGAASDDTIDLTQLSCSTISLTTGALVITQATLAINGPGQNKLAIDGSNAGAVLNHAGNGTLSLNGISIINGNKYRNDGPGIGACIHANSNLRLENVTISHCKASAGGIWSAFGGAVFVGGYAAVDSSTISDSSAVATDFGTAGGGGLYVEHGLAMHGSTITDNAASSNYPLQTFGGGVVVASGEVRIGESTISAN